MPELIPLYKNLGETPLETITRHKESHPEYKDIPMTYLGRLDPAAEGLLLVLAGNTRDKEKYLSWDKTYEFEVLWQFETDTYDILGRIIKFDTNFIKLNLHRNDALNKFDSLLSKVQKIIKLPYPAYSSRTVLGKPLFMWARENKIEEVDIPEKRIKIFRVEHVHTRNISGEEILSEVERKIALVRGDFRQEEILKDWRNTLEGKEKELFLASFFKADVSSGTYIRSLAHEMGKLLNTCAIAYSIKRTRVGEYKL